MDGFPRNLAQAEALDSMLKKNGLSVDKVISLEVPHGVLLGRLTGRRVCSQCGAVFHIETKQPRTSGVCDQCGGGLIQRNDDKAEVIETRLKTYEQSTAPLKGYYGQTGKLVALKGDLETEQVYHSVEQVLE